MVLVLATGQTSRVAFFKTFAAYHVPLRPRSPISFEGTRGLASYCIAEYQEDGRLAELTKVIVERQGTGEVSLPEPHEPGSVLFFSAGGPDSSGPAPERQIDYPESRDQDVYYQGRVTASGREVQWELLRRRLFFRERYLYRPSGALLERVVLRADGSVSRWTYTEAGQPVPVGKGEEKQGPALAF